MKKCTTVGEENCKKNKMFFIICQNIPGMCFIYLSPPIITTISGRILLSFYSFPHFPCIFLPSRLALSFFPFPPLFPAIVSSFIPSLPSFPFKFHPSRLFSHLFLPSNPFISSPSSFQLFLFLLFHLHLHRILRWDRCYTWNLGSNLIVSLWEWAILMTIVLQTSSNWTIMRTATTKWKDGWWIKTKRRFMLA